MLQQLMSTCKFSRLIIIKAGLLVTCLLVTGSYSQAQTGDTQQGTDDVQLQITDDHPSDANQTESTDSELTAEESPQDTSADSNSTQNQIGVFDIDMLVERMKQTDAIGVISKLSLKNKVDDLLEQAEEIKAGESSADSSKEKQALREEFEGLILKTVALLNKGEDFTLAEDIYQAREELWNSIMENKA